MAAQARRLRNARSNAVTQLIKLNFFMQSFFPWMRRILWRPCVCLRGETYFFVAGETPLDLGVSNTGWERPALVTQGCGTHRRTR